MLQSRWSTVPIFAKSNNIYTYYYTDHLGTPQQLIDKSGLVKWSANYEIFGDANVQNNIITNNLRFPGQYFDSESGLHYNNLRYYDPKIGRYIQSDPSGIVGGNNIYTYVNNNPINYTDPAGLWKYYGNWGGPGWTNGTDKWTENENFPRKGQPGFKAPINPRDACYYNHDVCLRDCAKVKDKCNRKECRSDCDIALSQCLSKLKGKYGNTSSGEFLFKNIRPNNNPGDYYP